MNIIYYIHEIDMTKVDKMNGISRQYLFWFIDR
jgi:hypothetical protein